MSKALHRLTPAAADRLRAQAPTYDGTRLGHQQLERRVVLGLGRDLFERASGALLSWELQLRSGIAVKASSARVEEGAVAMLLLGPLRAPVRVRYVVEEPTRRGFAYITLPGHPESGEELFLLDLTDDVVTLTITATSRPATLLARAGGPVTRWAQLRITRRYERALRR
jgi:uncharacterized protein (UPF0548 family)